MLNGHIMWEYYINSEREREREREFNVVQIK